MIKTLIKHIIGETAINSFFDNVNQNFMIINESIKIGTHLAELKTSTMFEPGKYRHVIYYDVIINDISNKVISLYCFRRYIYYTGPGTETMQSIRDITQAHTILWWITRDEIVL